jgi:hypothetical protein
MVPVKANSKQFRGFLQDGFVTDALLRPYFTPGNLYLVKITTYFDEYGNETSIEMIIVDELTGFSKLIELPPYYINDLFIEAKSPAASVLFAKPSK